MMNAFARRSNVRFRDAIRLLPVIAAFVGMGGVQPLQAAMPEVQGVYAATDPLGTPQSLAAGDSIIIVVQFRSTVSPDGITVTPNATTGEYPYLELDLWPQGQGEQHRAIFSGVFNNLVTFTYTAKGGDFSPNLNYIDRSSLRVPQGASITDTATGDVWQPFHLALVGGLPAPTASQALGQTSNIDVRTVVLNGPATANKNSTVNLTVSRQEVRNRDMTVNMTYPPEIGGSPPNSVVIPAGSSSYTFPVVPITPTSPDTIEIRARPQGYQTSAGDAIHELVIIDAPPPNVLEVSALSGTYGVGADVEIVVQFDRNISVTPGPNGEVPYLSLQLAPANRRAYMDSVAEDEVTFVLEVLPGDFSALLSYPTATSLRLNNATISDIATGAPWQTSQGIPAPGTSGALDVTSNVRIETLQIIGPATVQDGDTAQIVVNRGGNRAETLTVQMFYPTDYISGPSPLTIPAGESQVEATITGIFPSETNVLIRARGQNYPTNGDGDVTHSILVDGLPPRLELLGGLTQLSEHERGSFPRTTTWTLRRTGSGATTGDLLVELSFTDTSPGTDVISIPDNVIIPNGVDTTTFVVTALDGNFSAFVTASDPDDVYPDSIPRTVLVENVRPWDIRPNFTPQAPIINQPVTFTFQASDVPADRDSIRGTWIWPAGPPTEDVPTGEPSVFTFTEAGVYTIILQVTDKDSRGDPVLVEFEVEVTSGVSLTIHIPGPGYESLSNVGSGEVFLSPTPVFTNSVGPASFSVQYRPGQLVQIRGVPFQPDAQGFNSYIYAMTVDAEPEAFSPAPIAGWSATENTINVRMDDDHEVYVLFSREWRQGDGRGDIDGDGLTDEWERRWFSPETGADPERASDPWSVSDGIFPSGDRMPNAPSVVVDPTDLFPDGTAGSGPFGYPIPWSANWTGYAPVGPGFNNLFHQRGQTLNLWDADSPWLLGGGLNPLRADTSGDGLNDGWLYYFWANAVNNSNFVGRAYDPSTITGSLVISNADILYYFNPRYDRGLAGMDLDGDGLTVIEEYYLGTNPIDWDTDGDGMADGWEVLYGLNPLDPRDRGQNLDGDYMAYYFDPVSSIEYLHHDVYQLFGYDPRTAWAPNVFVPDGTLHQFDHSAQPPVWLGPSSNVRIWLGDAPNTRPYRNIDEYRVMRWHIDRGHVSSVSPHEWMTWSTDPLLPNSNYRINNPSLDRMPDGWKLYVGMIPSQASGTADPDRDDLNNNEEFSCWGVAIGVYPPSDATAVNNALHPMDVLLGILEARDRAPNFSGAQQENWLNQFAMLDTGWLNKFWPTDPFNFDTSGDQVWDGQSAGIFRYQVQNMTGTPVMRNPREVACFAGGGLNPTSVDTDNDGLPDSWEFYFAGGTSAGGYGPVQVETGDGETAWVRTGMDGTWRDAHDDYDSDGLANYQEYLTGAVYHFQYDKWTKGLGYGGYDPFDFFNPDVYGAAPHGWDRALWWNEQLGIPFFFQLAEPRPLRGPGLHFASTDPRDWDTDGDGMCDYYELFHGLNPLWAAGRDIVGKYLQPTIHDARIAPWQVGHEDADPDQDGIPNWEEALHPNRVDPQPHHTDPTPYWFTDMSYSESFVNLYYQIGSNLPFFWGPFPVASPPSYMFDFASNEGYDTDNDMISDKQELIGSDSPGSTDPLNFNDPLRRNALYLDGDAAARTRAGFFHGSQVLRSWTVELWVKAEQPATGAQQIIIERPVSYEPGDPGPPTELVRRNFRIGLDEQGRLFAEYDNRGSDQLTERPRASTGGVQAGEWMHVAATYSGTDEKLRLYVNGNLQNTVHVNLIPTNGSVYGWPDKFRTAPIVVGAADRNPEGFVAGAPRYYNHMTFDPPAQPDLHSYFKGWVDEIRIWNGARTHSEINLNQLLRMRMPDVQAQQPHLMYHFNFNSLTDPNYEGIVPAGFDSLNGRPMDGSYPGVHWWKESADRSRVYDNYLYVPWIQNMVAHLPLDSPLDSVYWAESSTGGQPANNRFPNSANPYHHGYRHALTELTERNPEFGEPIASMAFDPAVNRLYNNLLPLRNAVADQDVDLWDGFGPGSSLEYDSSGDGMPDWWKRMHGLDPYSSEGDDGSWGDPDRDSLPNWAEYLAWYQFGVFLDPFDYDTFNDGWSDYDSRPHALSPTFGQLYDDWDGMPGLWEIQHGLNPHAYEAHFDHDGDGWSNYAEFMAGTQPNDPNSFPKPALIFDVSYDGDQHFGQLVVESYSKPSMDGAPDARFVQNIQSAMAVTDEYMTTVRRGTRTYSGKLSIAPIVPGSLTIVINRTPSSYFAEVFTGVQAEGGAWTQQLQAPYGSTGTINYMTGEWTITFSSNINMGYIDGTSMRADYTSNLQGSAFPFRFSRDLPQSGHLREGRNWFFVYLDVGGTGGWSQGDPASVLAADLSWSALDADITLRDRAFGFPRFGWTPVNAEYRDVSIRLGTGATIFAKRLRGPRHYLHEGDLLYLESSSAYYNQRHGLSVDVNTPTYNWTVTHADGQVETGSFQFAWADPNDLPRDPPAMESPISGVVNDARVEFRWTMDERNASVRFEMRRDDPDTGPVVIDGIYPAPTRRRGMGHDYAYRLLPQIVGRRFIELPDGDYYWRVSTVTPGASTMFDMTPSGWAFVRLDRTSGSTGPYNISGELRYLGPVDHPVTVQAYQFGFSGYPVAQTTVTGPNEPFSLRGLRKGAYYLRAFMDQTQSGYPEVWETGGLLFDPGIEDPWPNRALKTVNVGPNHIGNVIYLRDRDTDNDRLPDAWEFEQAGDLTTLGVNNSSPPVWQSGPLSTTSSGTMEVSSEPLMGDSNDDGVPDLLKLYMGAQVFAEDSVGDGYSDLMRFFSLTDSETGEVVLPFSIPSLRINAAGQPVVGWDVPEQSLALALSLGYGMVYEIQWRAALDEGAWETVAQAIPGSFSQAGRYEWTDISEARAGQGYYRIRANIAERVYSITE